MKRSHVGWVLAAIVVSQFAIGIAFGFDDMACDENCSGQSIEVLLVVAAGLATGLLAWRFPRSASPQTLGPPVKLLERFIAFHMDVWVIMITAFSIFALLLLLLNFGLTGTLSWTLLSAETVMTEFIDGVFVVVLWFLIFAYFWQHKKKGRATIGQYIMGFKFEDAPDELHGPRYAYGTFSAFGALLMWPFWIWFVSRQDRNTGQYWWDREGRTKAVRIID